MSVSTSRGPVEPTAARASRSITVPVTALSSRAPSAFSDPRICGSTSRPLMSAPIAIGPDRSNTSTPDSRHKRVGRPGVAKLQAHRRIDQFGDDRPAAQRREPRLRPADGLAVTDRDRAHRCMAAVEHRGKAKVDRLRRQHQSRPAEAANAQVGAPARRPVPAIIDPAAGDPAKPEARARRGRATASASPRCRREARAGRRSAPKPCRARRRSEAASAQSPSRHQPWSAPPRCRAPAAAVRLRRLPVTLIRSGATSASVTKLNACRAPGQRRADLARRH